MNLTKVQMTWDEVTKLPSPLKLGKGTVRVNRFDSTRIYFEFQGKESANLREIYGQIKVWLLNARCVSMLYTYEGCLPTKELSRIKFTRSNDKIWRKKHDYLHIAAIPLENSWILSIENREGKKGVSADACDLSSLFSCQLSIDAEGQVVAS